jgi:hypothetical protein
MSEHVSIRCGPFRILFPTENIGFIEASPVPFHRPARRRDVDQAHLMVDLRVLSGEAEAASTHGVMLQWRSTDGARAMQLIVDAVEEIIDCQEEELRPAPILPKRLCPLIDRVVRAPSGAFLLRVVPDVDLTLRSVAERRLYARSLMVPDLSFQESFTL